MLAIEQFIAESLQGVKSDNILGNQKSRLVALATYFYLKYFGRNTIESPLMCESMFYEFASLPLDIVIDYDKVDGDRNTRSATRFEPFVERTLQGTGKLVGAGNEYIRYYDLSQNGWRCFSSRNLNKWQLYGINEDLWNNTTQEERAVLENEWLEEYQELSSKYLQYAHLMQDLEEIYPIVIELNQLIDNDSIKYYWFNAGETFASVAKQKGSTKEILLLTGGEIQYYLSDWDREQAFESQRLIEVGEFTLAEPPIFVDNFTLSAGGELVWEHPNKTNKLKPLQQPKQVQPAVIPSQPSKQPIQQAEEDFITFAIEQNGIIVKSIIIEKSKMAEFGFKIVAGKKEEGTCLTR